MASRITKDYVCNNCGAEYMLTYDEDNILEEPKFCPFCGPKNLLLDDDELDIDGLDFDD
jgi:DNA-directed RNA polymerase subunit RPC12/RpoP